MTSTSSIYIEHVALVYSDSHYYDNRVWFISDTFSSNSTAVIPRNRLAMVAEMKVKVVSKDSRGQDVDHGEKMMSCRLTPVGKISKECKVTDNSDGTYFVSVTPQQLGQHKLSITINGQDIHGSPFDLSVVPQRDYTKLKDPVQTITGISFPMYIAFSDKGDMFVTSYNGKCVHVYDSSRKKKTTIVSGLVIVMDYYILYDGVYVYVCIWDC